MFQTQLINAVVQWERRLQIEEEKQKNLKGEPYKKFTVTPQPYQKERKSIFTRIFKQSSVSVNMDYCCCTYDQCQEAQPG